MIDKYEGCKHCCCSDCLKECKECNDCEEGSCGLGHCKDFSTEEGEINE